MRVCVCVCVCVCVLYLWPASYGMCVNVCSPVWFSHSPFTFRSVSEVAVCSLIAWQDSKTRIGLW